MSSRSAYDLVDTLEKFNALKQESGDPNFAQKYYSLDGIYRNVAQTEESPGLISGIGKIPIQGRAAVPFTCSIPNSTLCEKCNSVIASSAAAWQTKDSPESTEQDITYSYLCRSAEAGCHLCHLRLSRLRKHDVALVERIHSCKYKFWINTLPKNSLFSLGRTMLESRGLDLRYSVSDEEEPLEDVGFILCQAEQMTNSPLEDEAMGSPLGTDNSTSPPWKLMQFWIDDCDANHKFCKAKLEGGRVLPTRLIHISPASDQSIILTVLETKSLSQDTRYVTLSHCWGQSPFHKFIRGCREDYFHSIPVAQIPQLFQDAVMITTKLGIRYLWIDCFCIKQGSEDDWLSESAMMDRVYQFSSLNLAACRSSSCDESMIATRIILDLTPCIIQTDWDRDNDGVTGKRWVLFHDDLYDQQNIQKTPLAERGWVVQEVVLAPRVLSWGKSQLFWECNELRACETFPLGVPGATRRKSSIHPLSLQFDFTRGTDGELYKYRIWKQMVGRYSRCKLSEVTKDKLIAVSGLAKAIGAPQEDYLAGMWRRDLAYQLLWYHKGPGKRAPLNQPSYQAPTWSWASFNGPVSYVIREPPNDPAAELLIRITEAVTEKQDDDPTGRVQSGYIQIEGPLAYATFSTGKAEGGREWRTLNGGFGVRTVEDPDVLSTAHSVYCMPVELKTRKGGAHTLVTGLLLYTTLEKPDKLQRFGYFTVTDHEGRHEMNLFIKSFRDKSEQPPLSLAKPVTAQTAAAIVFGFPTYSFRII